MYGCALQERVEELEAAAEGAAGASPEAAAELEQARREAADAQGKCCGCNRAGRGGCAGAGSCEGGCGGGAGPRQDPGAGEGHPHEKVGCLWHMLSSACRVSQKRHQHCPLCRRCAKIQARAKQAAAESQERQAQMAAEFEAVRASADEAAALRQSLTDLEAGQASAAEERSALAEAKEQLEAEVGTQQPCSVAADPPRAY